MKKWILLSLVIAGLVQWHSKTNKTNITTEEKELDEALEDTFPASDPITKYI